MRRYLVIANQTLVSEPLLAQVREVMRRDECEFHLVVPATPPREHLTWTEGEAFTIAETRLNEGMELLRSEGATVTGEVGDAHPMLAVDDALRQQRYDEVIISTLAPTVSRWLKLNLPDRVQRRYGLPVTHVVSEAVANGS
jgi:GABA permease